MFRFGQWGGYKSCTQKVPEGHIWCSAERNAHRYDEGDGADEAPDEVVINPQPTAAKQWMQKPL